MSATILLCLALALAPSCAERPPPDIVLVVVDTLRADHLGAYGYARPTSPTIDALSKTGTLFSNAASPSSWTKPAVASLFSSRLPSEHGAVSCARDLGPELPLLAEALRARGYYTVGVSANFVHIAAPRGFGRGFDVFESPNVEVAGEGEHIIELQNGSGPPRRFRAANGHEINAIVARILRERPKKPLFLYVHYMEPHAGYEPPERLAKAFSRDRSFAQGAPAAHADYVSTLARAGSKVDPREIARLVDLYDAEIASVDEAIAELRDLVAAAGASRALWVVTADHGEEFGEHGGFFHGIHLHEETVHVPLVLAGPGVPATRRDEPVDLLDVAPTLLAAAGARALPGARGRDLLATALAPHDLIAELHADPEAEEHLVPRQDRFTVTRWPYRLFALRDGSLELYRRDRDPAEKVPLADPDPPLVNGLAGAGAEVWRPLDGGARTVDPAKREELRALGYAD